LWETPEQNVYLCSMKISWIEISINILFWIASAWFLVSGYSVVSVEHTIENDVESQVIIRDSALMFRIAGAITLSAILFYTNLYLITSRRLSGSNWKTGLYSLGAFIMALLLFHAISFFNWGTKLPLLPASLVFGIFTFYYAISIAYGLGISWLKSESDRKNLIIEKNNAELTLLRNQLQPHFLFNALNNLLSMINQKQYSGASNAIEKLALLLRYVIEETKAEKVKLTQEIQFIENYTSLQMLRFDPDEVDLKFSVQGNTDEVFVEPGLFLPFVENAFKYGAEPEVKSKIAITFEVSDDSIISFSVSNPVLKNNGALSTGTGIEATKNRLDLVYPKKYKLEISDTNDFIVQLKIFNS
jgi:sensor histidine kinase YesM